MLQTIEIETTPNPNAAVIWLHGLGADYHDFEPLVPEIVPRRERAWRFVFPNAPVRPVTINGGMSMRAWYDILGFDRLTTEDTAGFRDTDARVAELIGREIERGIPAARIVLAGFSQGGAVSLYTGLRYPERLAGLLALSCYLPLAGTLAAEASARQCRGADLHGSRSRGRRAADRHGAQSREKLKALGFAVEWHQYRMAHSVCQAEVADIREFLFRVLP